MSTSNSPSLLEDRFRAVLRVLPAYYRQEREEEMVDTFLSDHEPLDEDAELGRPRPREVAGVLALAIRTRLAGPGAPARYAAYGRTARLVGLLGVALLAATTAVSTLTDLAVLLAGSAQDQQMITDSLLGRVNGSSVDAFHTALALLDGVLLPLGWIAAAVALGRGHRRSAAVFCAVGALPWVQGFGRSVFEGFAPSMANMAMTALAVLVTLSVATAFHSGAPRAEISRLAVEWIPAACALVLLATIVVGHMILGFGGTGHVWVFVVGGVVSLGLRARARRRTAEPAEPSKSGSSASSPGGRGAPTRVTAADPALPAALAVLGLPMVAISLDATIYYLTPGFPTGALIAQVVQILGVSLLEATLLVVAARALRSESPLSAASPTTPASVPDTGL
ncbi:hypothetical protein [Streptomyces sp. NPDC047108]|uniref:hypothetical protein n=1 Tax=Streptomyces sp. NPDC047108 TaxID=3155025 RepID=UPI00340DCC7D